MSYIGLPFDGIDPLNIHMTLQDKTLTDSEESRSSRMHLCGLDPAKQVGLGFGNVLWY